MDAQHAERANGRRGDGAGSGPDGVVVAEALRSELLAPGDYLGRRSSSLALLSRRRPEVYMPSKSPRTAHPYSCYRRETRVGSKPLR